MIRLDFSSSSQSVLVFGATKSIIRNPKIVAHSAILSATESLNASAIARITLILTLWSLHAASDLYSAVINIFLSLTISAMFRKGQLMLAL